MTKLIHTMIRVSDLTKSLKFYRQALVLEIKNQYVFDDFTLTYLSNDSTDFELELTHNHNVNQEYTHGNGYGHIAASVDDIESVHKKMTMLNIKPSKVTTFHHHHKVLATFFFIADPDGYKIEFIQRKGRFA